MDMAFGNQINCQEKIEHTENEQDEVEIAFDDLDDSNAIALNLDSSGQYQLQGESVTYRLVQLTSPDEVQHILSSFSSNQTPLSSSNSQQGEVALMESNAISYVQTTTAQDINHLHHNHNSKKRQIIVLAAEQKQQQNGYTQTSHHNIHPKNIIPKNVIIKPEPLTKTMKDDRRRLTHKEVERRRRDKINNWIVQLGNLIPECSSQQQARQPDSKGGILSKACDYITELQCENHEMEECLKDFDEVKNHLQLLNQQFEQLKQENQLLRSHLQQQHFVDHSLITEGADANGVVLLDDATMVMEGNDSNNNFIAKYNFLNSNNDEDALYAENSCLSVEAGNLANNHNNLAHEHTHKDTSQSLDNKEPETYQAESHDAIFINKHKKAPSTYNQLCNNKPDEASVSSNVGNIKTIILKGVSNPKRRPTPLTNRITIKKSHKL